MSEASAPTHTVLTPRRLSGEAQAGDNRLPEIAEKIKAEYRGVFDAAKVVISKAIAFGELLIAEKAKFRHGDWLDWLETNCDLEKRTAQRYMKLAQNKGTIEGHLRTQQVELESLSFNKAMALIANGSSKNKNKYAKASDSYDTTEDKLVEKLKTMKLETAKASVANTNKRLKATLADMETVAAAQN